MKTLLVSLAVSAAAIASPAAAQYPSDGYQNRGNNYRDDDRAGANMAPRIEQMRVRIQAGMQSGAISRQEAVSLRANLRSLTLLERQYSRGGLTNQERQELQRRLRDCARMSAAPMAARTGATTIGTGRTIATTIAMTGGAMAPMVAGMMTTGTMMIASRHSAVALAA